MKDLTVEIPKQHRKQLSRRFSISNFTYNDLAECYENYAHCICGAYGRYCKGCPFKKFETEYSSGCIYWIRKIVGQKFMERMSFKIGGMQFDKKDKDFIKTALKKLKEGAKRYIEWV